MVPLGIIIEDDKLCMTNYTFQKSLKNTAAFIFPHICINMRQLSIYSIENYIE